jgi:hypothetical protein
MKIKTTPIPIKRTLFSLAVVLFVLFFAVILQSWLAGRLSIWGDESDTIMPALRVWKGHKDFLWQIGQYNANPPGDNLQLRWYYRSGALSWLKELAEGVYWRLPYILVYAFAVLAFFVQVLRWKRSPTAAAFAALFVATAHRVFIDGVEMRFYIWLVFFMSIAAPQVLYVFNRTELFSETERVSKDFVALCLICAFGALFHLMLVPVGYFVWAYSLLAISIGAYRFATRKKEPAPAKQRSFFSVFSRAFLVLLLGSLTFIIYKVELKHLIFVPHPWKEIDPWQKLFAAPISLFVDRISDTLAFPGFWKGGGLIALVILLAIALGFNLARREWNRALSGGFLLSMVAGSPLVLFWNSAARNYPLNVSHCVYQAPLIALSILYLLSEARAHAARFNELKKIVKQRRVNTLLTNTQKPASIAAICTMGAIATGLISSHAFGIKDFSPAKENFSFNLWRDYFRRVPGAKPLVVVGAEPGAMTADAGYIAGMLDRYTLEFRPIYLSDKGAVDWRNRPVSKGALKNFLSNPSTNYLLIGCEKLRNKFPMIPWEKIDSYQYPDKKLCHAQLKPKSR